MNELLLNSTFFGVTLSFFIYYLCTKLQKRFKLPILNPILISSLIIILLLCVCKVDYSTYNAGAKYLTYFLTPSTVALAIPLYEQFEVLKRNWKAILCGIVAGILANMLGVLLLSILFRFTHAEYITFLPKSITTAIGLGVSEELGGHVTITVVAIIITGIFGNMVAETAVKLFRITDPVAKGIAIGSASHAVGTAKAMELGEVEGAMSSLAIVVTGLLTVLAVMLFAGIY